LSFVDHVFERNKFNLRTIDNFRIDRPLFTEDLLRLKKRTNIRELLVKINEHSTSFYDKQEILLVGDKNPVYAVFTKRLVRIFPEAKFVCIIRDFRDNFVSLRNLTGVAMEAPVLPLQVARWRLTNEIFLKYHKKYPDRFYIIRYEDLVHDPGGEFMKICRFVNIPFDPGVLDFHVKKDEFVKLFPDPRIQEIHRSLGFPVNKSRIGLWKTALTQPESDLACKLAGSTARKLNYLSEVKPLSLAEFFRAMPWFFYAYFLFHLMIAGSYMPYRINRWLSLNILRLARIYKTFKK
jgi:hypothetical protein